MAPRWIHEFFDILTFGRSYWRVHREEDEASKYLGVEHRKVKHEFYQMFKHCNSNVFVRRIPELLPGLKDKKGGIRLIHSLIDKVWDELSLGQRMGSASVFKRLILEGQVKCGPGYMRDWLKLRDYVRNKSIEELLRVC